MVDTGVAWVSLSMPRCPGVPGGCLLVHRTQQDPPTSVPRLSFLENMLRSRIGRRTLAEQHIYLSQRREGYIGVISMDMNVADGVEFAAQRCRQVGTSMCPVG